METVVQMADRGNSPTKCILYSSPALAPLTQEVTTGVTAATRGQLTSLFSGASSYMLDLGLVR